MDFFLVAIVLFLLANVAVVINMLRRVNLHNDSVLAWEQQQVTAQQSATVQPLPVPQYDSVVLPKAA